MDWIAFAKQNPHEFTIQYPPRKEYFQDFFRCEKQEFKVDNHKEVLVYLHIPFCEQKCSYCNFSTDLRHDEHTFGRYTQALINEIESCGLFDSDINIGGIDIGGGTPTRLPIHYLQKILEALQPLKSKSNNNFPLSIESSPNVAANKPEMLAMLKESGVDRISVGFQSFSSQALLKSNRAKQMEQTFKAASNVIDANFKRFNIDLIFGLPGQNIHDWLRDINQVIEIFPDSITTYDCLYRTEQPLLTRTKKDLPAMSIYGEMYDIAYEKLINAGYLAEYGSLNFSKHKSESGVSAYFEGRLLDGKPYLGFGNYATSQFNNYWQFNTYKVNDYINQIEKAKSAVHDAYLLPDIELLAKNILYSLNFGIIDTLRLQKRFNMDINKTYAKELEYAENQNWIIFKNGVWKVKPGNFQNLNLLRSLFYSHNVKKWLKNLDNQNISY